MQSGVERRAVALHEVAQPLRDRQHPLADGQAGKDVVGQVRRCLGHAPGVARGAHAPAFAGKGYEDVVPTVVTAGAGKAVGKDAALQIFAKRLLHNLMTELLGNLIELQKRQASSSTGRASTQCT